MKRLISAMLAAFLAASLLIGCGGSGSATPAPAKEEASKIMDLTGKDMDGNDVKMGDLISSGKLTLINYWGTTCAPCVEEMPALEELLQKYGDQGLRVIGLCADALEEDNSISEGEFNDAKKIIADTGVTYPIVLATSELNAFVDSAATPVTLFVDKDGKPVGASIFGAQSKDKWEKIISERFSSVK